MPAPSFAHATVASMIPRWLRHRIATLSPAPIPACDQARASAFVRRWTSANVSDPRSSTIAMPSGCWTAEMA